MVNHARRFTPVAETEPSDTALALCSGEMLNTKQAMKRLKCSKAKLFALMGAGKIRFIQDGPRHMCIIPASEVVRYLASRLH